MTTYEVHLACDPFCDDYEEPRVVLVTDDAETAIKKQYQHSDYLHIADVRVRDHKHKLRIIVEKKYSHTMVFICTTCGARFVVNRLDYIFLERGGKLDWF